jgi:hypothetical protein
LIGELIVGFEKGEQEVYHATGELPEACQLLRRSVIS